MAKAAERTPAGKLPYVVGRKILLRPRMSFVVNRLQPLRSHMRIDLRCRKVHVTQELLNASQVRAVIQQMRRERMAQGMRRDMLDYAAFANVLIENAPDASIRKARA